MNGRLALGTLTVLVGVLLSLTGLRGTGMDVVRATPTQQVTGDPQQAINVNTSPVVAFHPDRPEVLVVAGRVDAPRLNCTLSVSTTGGEAWRPLELPPAPGATNCFWPDVAFDGAGNLLAIYTPTGGPFNLPVGLWLQRFTPALTADGPPVLVSGPLTFEPRLAIDGRRVLVAWVQAPESRATKFLGFGPPPNPILLARSDDGGRTFAPPVTVSDPGRLAVQPTLRAWGAGRVMVGALDLVDDRTTYESAHEGQPGPAPVERWRVVAWTSDDGGATFGPAKTVTDGIVPSQRVLIDLAPAPAFAVDPGRQRLYATWESGHDVVLSRSDDGGDTWTAPRRVGPARAAQFLPGIGVAPNGRVDVAFYDRSEDPDDVMARVVIASSADGGRSFTTATVSDTPFDSIVGSFTGENVMLGSHLAVASHDDGATAIWADGGRGNRTNNIVDLVAGTVDVRPARAARVAVVGAGVALVLLGMALTARSWPGRGSGRDRSPGRRREAWPPPPRRG